jgi:hypothetical protein
MFQTPLVLFIFNRPICTQRVINVLSKIRPNKLFVIADGPRSKIDSDVELCMSTRKIIDTIDWECDIIKKYADVNMGCRYRIPSGLDFVFSHVEECIILEDDCLPDLSFFKFCEELLDKYRENETIMTISGHRSDGPNEFKTESYFFSKYPNIWGWATWRNRWEKNDLEMKRWPILRNNSWLSTILKSKEAQVYWVRLFDSMLNNLDTWDYAWVYTNWLYNGLTIRPKVNMITNIGLGNKSSRMSKYQYESKFAEAQEMKFPLIHPTRIEIDQYADNRIEWVSFSGMDKRMLEVVRSRINKSRSNEGS